MNQDKDGHNASFFKNKVQNSLDKSPAEMILKTAKNYSVVVCNKKNLDFLIEKWQTFILPHSPFYSLQRLFFWEIFH